MSTSKVTTPSSSKASTKKDGSAPRQSRFRGDVPAFNPTGQSPFVLAQQYQTPPQAFPQQQQPYQQHPQMMYGGQVPGAYMQYMGYPEYMMGYPYYPMPTTPFPQPYMAPHMNSMNGMNDAYPPQQAPEPASTLSEETPPTTQVIEQEETKQTEVEEPKPKKEESVPVGTFPLLFSTSHEEYSSARSEAASEKKNLLASKLGRVQKYVQQQKTQSGGLANLIINKNATFTVLDHSTGKSATQLIYPAELANSESADQEQPNNDNDSNDATTRPSNWASVLQSTATKKVSKKTASASKTTQAAVESKSASPTPSINNGPQALGLLSLKMLFEPEFSLNSYPSYSINPRGLTNTGNICYMNAVLQCLMFCEPFNKLIRYVDEHAVGSLDKTSQQPIVDATINFIKDFLKLTTQNGSNGSNGTLNSHGIVVGRPLSPEVLYQKLVENTKFKHLKWGQQEDAEEFLTYFLDGLHEDFVRAEATVPTTQVDELIDFCQQKLNDSASKQNVKSKIKTAYRVTKQSLNHGEEMEASDEEEETNGWSEVGSGKRVSKKRVVDVEPSPITSIFGGRFRSVLTIPKGKESQSITVDPFRCMSVDISQKDVTTIEDALWNSHQIEKIPFKIDAEREVTAKKQTFIDQLPKVLLLQLKRFAYQQEADNSSREGSAEPNGKESVSYGTIEKVMKDVKFDLDLEIPPECLSSTLRSADPKPAYKLVGVIYHHGRNAEGGHYTCDVYRNGIAETSTASEKKWLRIDDTSVEAISSDAVVETPRPRTRVRTF
ncbi:uncharacterized protein CXQ87_003081 [Candidozyma duobushaemuli]|uniref:Ubiquitin carboxyl-terminal hydrolase n=1 Tax=Candidozyma duobushaemuli TaxID=1231522 RepID=A0A2V1AD92_9ASCO|nr:uncharacterized protein CXQ87_003081 [[Candida] duobushaemulonis]PVH15243.1 hypothetical protein CXQ87_003081 [[Candida] duobushaemulonis]